MCEFEAFYEMVKKWTVSDYRTQKIKAEVLVDMLISEFIEEIVYYKLGKDEKAILIAKEFPITRVGQCGLKEEGKNLIQKIKDGTVKSDDIGKRQYASADYLIKCGNTLYLTELKTTNSSIDGVQLLNMLWTCEKGLESLYYRFFDLIKNYSIEENALSDKKYFYTLKYMAERVLGKDKVKEIDIAAFGRKRERKKYRADVARQIMDTIFCSDKSDLRNCNMIDINNCDLKILYVSLHPMKNDDIFKEVNKKDTPIALRDYGNKVLSDKSNYENRFCACPIILKDIVNEHDFVNMLEDDKRRKWNKVKDILNLLVIEENEWFEKKEKINHEKP